MTLLGVGMMIGGGIFAIIGLGAHLAGPSLILSFAVCTHQRSFFAQPFDHNS
jgi:L-asparagine transporter-like permease